MSSPLPDLSQHRPRARRRSSVSLSNTSSSSSSDGYYNSDDELALIRLQEQKEWEEGVEQLQMLISAVLIPVLGKWMGRRWSGWLYDRYLRVGLGKTFFFGQRLAGIWTTTSVF
ncbi:hypothetical protein FRB94_004767 [Tulasnella sp. JGI-2019a]|nr:hypothetical protein FRB93_004845 [Tulasnella sp. JGI-2019a]KAG9001452.1 hypothetical protein FRB94_004767 [Tulasnella sp. JGI-2019a]KAG9031590.1 hypothetical protein FRB95_002519 [Tulasnella sp. JGI-2019a]